MRVAVYPADEGGCGYYRLIHPARVLAAAGYDIDLVLPTDPQERQLHAKWRTTLDGSHREVVDVVAPDADVVVIQRPLYGHLADTIPLLQAKGVRVVVEIDDDFEAISPRNISWARVQPGANPERNRKHLARACQIADLVTVSTPALARRYGSHGRVAVLPNLIPESYLSVTREPHHGIYVGWSGSLTTHPDDLQVCGGAIAQVIRETGATFAVVGTGAGVQRALALDVPPVACGWRPIEEYPTAVAEFDVGIVPLELTPFNEAKSYLKGLEMAAVGVPFVASPTGPYRHLARLGVGEIAAKPKDWRRIVKGLVVNHEWRTEQAGRVREIVSSMTYERHADRWWSAWERVLDREAVPA